MNAFLSRAEEILEIAAQGDGNANTAILIDRQGGMRMVEASGWSLVGLAAEYGAAAVYRLQRTSGAVRVEGWNGSQRCLVERSEPANLLSWLPGVPALAQAVKLQVRLGAAC